MGFIVGSEYLQTLFGRFAGKTTKETIGTDNSIGNANHISRFSSWIIASWLSKVSMSGWEGCPERKSERCKGITSDSHCRVPLPSTNLKGLLEYVYIKTFEGTKIIMIDHQLDGPINRDVKLNVLDGWPEWKLSCDCFALTFFAKKVISICVPYSLLTYDGYEGNLHGKPSEHGCKFPSYFWTARYRYESLSYPNDLIA